MSKIVIRDYGFAEYPRWVCTSCNKELAYVLLPINNLPSVKEFTADSKNSSCPYCGTNLLKRENKNEQGN